MKRLTPANEVDLISILRDPWEEVTDYTCKRSNENAVREYLRYWCTNLCACIIPDRDPEQQARVASVLTACMLGWYRERCAAYLVSIGESLRAGPSHETVLRRQLQMERDASVYAISHAIAWRDGNGESDGLERVAWYLDTVRKESPFPYEPGPWSQTGATRADFPAIVPPPAKERSGDG